MRTVALDPRTPLIVHIHVDPPDAFWEVPRARLELHTGDYGGVTLDFSDPVALRLVARAVRDLWIHYRRDRIRLLSRPVPRSLPLP